MAIGAARHEAAFLAGPQDAPMDRLEPVAHVGQRAADDHAHRVIEIRRLHLIDDVDAFELARGGGRLKGIGRVVHLRGWPVLLICRSVAPALGHRPRTGQRKGRASGAGGPFFHTCRRSSLAVAEEREMSFG